MGIIKFSFFPPKGKFQMKIVLGMAKAEDGEHLDKMKHFIRIFEWSSRRCDWTRI